MRIKAELVHKYPVQSGVSQNTGNPWQRQDMKFKMLREDWTESTETLVVSTSNAMIIDAFQKYEAGARGELSLWCNADEYNGRCYNRINMQNWTPQSEATKVVAEQMQQQAPQEQNPAQAFAPAQNAAGDSLPF